MLNTKKIINKIGLYRFIICVISIISLIGLFLPYESATGKYREYLLNNPNEPNFNMKNKEVVDISIIENIEINEYARLNTLGFSSIENRANIGIVTTYILIISIVLIFVFGMVNKYYMVLISNIIMLVSSFVLNYNTFDKGKENLKVYGISFYLYIIIGIILFYINVIFISKRKNLYKKNK